MLWSYIYTRFLTDRFNNVLKCAPLRVVNYIRLTYVFPKSPSINCCQANNYCVQLTMTNFLEAKQMSEWLEISGNEYAEIGEMGLCAWGSVTELIYDGHRFRFYQNTEISYGTTTSTFARRTVHGTTEYFTAQRGAVIWNDERIEKKANEDYFKELAQEIMAQEGADGFEQSPECQASYLLEHEQAQIHALVRFANYSWECALDYYDDVTLFQGSEREYLEEELAQELEALNLPRCELTDFLLSCADGESYGRYFGLSYDTFEFNGEAYVLVDLGR